MTDDRTLKNIIKTQREEIEKWKHYWNQEAVKIEKAHEILAEFPAKFPLNDINGAIEIWHFEDLTKIIKRLRECLSGKQTGEQK